MKILPVVFLLCLAATVAAQPVPRRVERLTIDDGLSQNYIFSAMQDHIGYLWFGTKDGLNKFDGYRFTVYRHDRNDPHSLADNNITALYEDSSNTLWAGTSTGALHRFDRRTEQFERYADRSDYPQHLRASPISLIREFPRGTLWIGTSGGGLFRYDAAADRFTEFASDSGKTATLPAPYINGFAVGPRGTIWIGTGSGLASIDPYNPAVRRYLRSGPDERGSFNMISALFFEDTSSLWVGQRVGLDRFHPSTGTFERMLIASDSAPYYWPSKIVRGDGGTLWIGFVHDLVAFDPLKRSAASVLTIDPERFTKSLVVDRSGIVWIGSTGWGVYKYNPFVMRFGRRDGNFLREVYGDAIDRVTALLAHRKPRTQRLFDPSLHGGNFQAMLRDRAGNTWIAGLEQPVVYEVMNGGNSIREIPTLPARHAAPFPLAVTGIYQGHGDTVWFGTVGGVMSVAPGANEAEYHRVAPGKELSPGPLNRYSYPDITCFHQDRSGILWLGTPNLGLVRYDPAVRSVRYFRHNSADSTSISSDHVLTICPDPSVPNDILWIGTDGGGLNRFDIRSATAEVLTEREGLPNNVVYGILPDSSGALWMSTNRGLSRFDPQQRRFRNFDMNDGLQSNEFNRMEYLKTPDGRMYFGGINGYNVFHPGDITENRTIPPVVLTDLKIRNQSVSFTDPASPLHAPLSETDRIELQYSQNMVTFEFAALEFSSPKSNQYAYVLEGFNQDWIFSGTTRTATYTNLDPGTYRFRVKASNNDGVWNEEGTSLIVTVLPPFWMTWWFRLTGGLLFLSIGPFIYFRRVSALEREQRRQQEFSRRLIESQEAERRRIAAEMHDSLGQDVLLIHNRALLALQDPGNAAAMGEHLRQISESTTGMVGNIRQIAHNLRPIHLERFGLTDTLTIAVEQAAASSPLIWTWEIDPIDGLIPKEEEINFFRVVQEGINNILKHAEASEARVEVKVHGRAIVLRITDDGKGFDLTAALGKSGLGLHGISERVRVLGGTLAITSVPGDTVITVTIPIRANEER